MSTIPDAFARRAPSSPSVVLGSEWCATADEDRHYSFRMVHYYLALNDLPRGQQLHPFAAVSARIACVLLAQAAKIKRVPV